MLDNSLKLKDSSQFKIKKKTKFVFNSGSTFFPYSLAQATKAKVYKFANLAALKTEIRDKGYC